MAMESLKEPAILFFILGILSVFLKTNLKIPEGLSRFLSLYLLMAIGFKGGLSLSKTGITIEFVYCLIGGILTACVIPTIVFFMLRKKLSTANAAGVAATYGSVSAVTFVAATTLLDSFSIEYSGSMIAILALMEAPAIMIALFLYGRNAEQSVRVSPSKLLHEAILNSSVYLLLGSVLIGLVSGPFGKESVGHLVIDLFKGLLCFFLLDLGIKAGKTIRSLEMPAWLIPVALAIPLFGAGLAISYSYFLGISAPQAFLLTSLCAGASYIAVPAALRFALPEANSGIYLTMALGVTFPFNILIGLPIYWKIISALA